MPLRNANPGKKLRSLVLCSIFAAVTAMLSFVAIPVPLSPAPITGQTLGVMLAGLVLGQWWGTAAILVYLGMGLLGIPVFAGGRSGLGALTGPTGGYLVGFVPGAWVTGMLVAGSRRTRSHAARLHKVDPQTARPQTAQHQVARSTTRFRISFAAALCGGVAVVHVVGSLWLAYSTGRPPGQAFLVGSAPFLLGDIAKAVVAAMVGARLLNLDWS